MQCLLHSVRPTSWILSGDGYVMSNELSTTQGCCLPLGTARTAATTRIRTATFTADWQAPVRRLPSTTAIVSYFVGGDAMIPSRKRSWQATAILVTTALPLGQAAHADVQSGQCRQWSWAARDWDCSDSKLGPNGAIGSIGHGLLDMHLKAGNLGWLMAAPNRQPFPTCRRP